MQKCTLTLSQILKFLNTSILNITTMEWEKAACIKCVCRNPDGISASCYFRSARQNRRNTCLVSRAYIEPWLEFDLINKQIKSLVTEGLNCFSTTKLNWEWSCLCKIYRLVPSASSCLCDHMTGSFGWLVFRFLNSSAPIITMEWKKQHVFVWRISYSA